MKLKICFSLVITVVSLRGIAQTDWKKIFPEAEAVYTNLLCDINIKRENGKLIAISEYDENLLYLTDNSVKMMSRGHIYHSSFNELKKWEAYTQLPNEKKKLKISNASTANSTQDYIFYDDTKSTSFDYTGAIVGATRHLDYQLQNNDVHLLSPYYFERYFPIGEAELRVNFPSDVKIKYIAKGLHADKIIFSETKKKDKTTYSFRVSNINSTRTYPDAPDNSYYATHLIFYIEQVKENDEWKNFLSNPDDLYKNNYNYISNINKTRSTELENLTDSITRNAKTDLEKAKAVYRWVQANIKYVAFEDGMEGFIPREANLVCSRRFGDCKDMTSILTSMLNYAKVPAYFTWIGTRDIPYDYSEVPLPIVDNHMICTVKIGDEYIFLDGTDNGCIFGLPSSHIQGKQAMVSINEKEYKIIRVPVVEKEKNVFTDTTFIELTDKGIKGQVRIKMTGYYASGLQSALSYRNEEERNEYFKTRYTRGNNKVKFSNWNLNQSVDRNQVEITADFELPDYAKKLGDEWFINMNLFKWYEHEEIDFPKRKIPIEFSFLKHSSYVTVVKIPQGYKASYVPKSDVFKNDVWGFTVNYNVANDKVYLTQEFETDQLLLYPNQFESWNKVLERLLPNYKQTISLRKN